MFHFTYLCRKNSNACILRLLLYLHGAASRALSVVDSLNVSKNTRPFVKGLRYCDKFFSDP